MLWSKIVHLAAIKRRDGVMPVFDGAAAFHTDSTLAISHPHWADPPNHAMDLLGHRGVLTVAQLARVTVYNSSTARDFDPRPHITKRHGTNTESVASCVN